MAVGLPFGWAPAPIAFTKFIRQILRAIRSPSIIISNQFLITSYYE